MCLLLLYSSLLQLALLFLPCGNSDSALPPRLYFFTVQNVLLKKKKKPKNINNSPPLGVADSWAASPLIATATATPLPGRGVAAARRLPGRRYGPIGGGGARPAPRAAAGGIMDPSLLRERELFKKRALSTPAVEKRPAPSSDSSSSKKKKAKVEQGGSSSSKQNADHSNGSFNLKALSGGSGYKFGVLAKIVNYMKTRHQRGDTHPLTLEEILDETQHLDIGLKQKQWLMSEALVNNPKIEVVDGKYAFKPKYNLKDKKALLRLLDKHDQRGLGGILLEDIEEGLPNAQKAIKALGDQIIFVNRPDKKKILFYNDKSCQFTVDEDNWHPTILKELSEGDLYPIALSL
ncbi:transcription initiation factor IIE subunit beta isoform X2 [Buteo buteo]|uniref:transcription initiation factor IIE subunit beta isoform X2 n=1 Tax=Buteo buteo TaxID=30397 RepID=UPI003EB998E6